MKLMYEDVQKSMTVPEDLSYNGEVILEKNSRLHEVDWVLIETAILLEKRYEEFQAGKRNPESRDPSFSPVVRPSECSAKESESEELALFVFRPYFTELFTSCLCRIASINAWKSSLCHAS